MISKRILEIDGLRGIIILLIIMSHFNDSIFQSGGVNAFFVISGFFITKIINDQGYSFKVLDFYISRIKGLYPQLIFSSIMIFTIYLFN